MSRSTLIYILITCSLGFVLGLTLIQFSSTPSQHLPVSSMLVNGIERTYHLFVPDQPAKEPMPLLVAFHGGGGKGEVFPQQSAFESLAQDEKFIIALPQGHLLSGNEGEWQLNTDSTRQHDIEFIQAMIDEISMIHQVDSSRIYATGYSLGSMFTYEIACQMSDRFASIASFAGTMPITHGQCEPQRYAPILHIHGDDDWIISYSDTWTWKAWDEVGPMRNISDLIDFWQSKYACQSQNQTDFPSATHFIYNDCNQEARVEHYRLHGTGHKWPSTINGVSTHRVIWEFLSNVSL